MNALKIFVFILLCATFASCGVSNRMTKGEQYAKFYEENPAVLLVMPPINNTTSVDAKEFLYTSISRPLVEKGYYVISPHLAMDIFKNESAYDAELFIDQDVSQFGQVFGADAVIFSEILTWKKVGVGIETDLKYTIKSTHTNEVVFERTCNFFLDLSVQNTGGGLVGALVAATATLINTAVTDNIVAARKCNSYVFQDLPRGKYDPLYQKDKEEDALDKELHRSINR